MKPKVLVIDSEKIICKSTAASLETMGIEANFTSDFGSAIYLLNVMKYDCIIIDPILHDRDKDEIIFPGIELIEKARKNYPKLPIIIRSSVDSNFIKKLLSKNIVKTINFFVKAFDETEFYRTLASIMGLSVDAFENWMLHEYPEYKVKVFISYAKEDFSKAFAIHNILESHHFNSWIDKDKLIVGQDWELEISNAIKQAHFFVACLSNSSVSKTGYVQKELKKGLDILNLQPEGAIYLIPVRLEECKVPNSCEKIQWLDLFEINGFDKFIDGLLNACVKRGLIPA